MYLQSIDDLDAYQLYMADLIHKNKQLAIALWAEQGLGKTIATLTSIARLLREFEVTKILIIAPKLVAEVTWPDEINKWQHIKHIKYSVVTGNEKQRIEALQKQVQVYIINRENIVWLWDYLGDDHGFDMMVYDEADRLKGGRKKSAASKTLGKDGKPKERNISEFGAVCKFRKVIPRVLQLSGTPTPLGLIDLWGPIYILDRGLRLKTSMAAFKKEWFHESKYDYSIEPRTGAFDDILNRLSDICFTFKSDDYIELPKRTPLIKEVILSDKVMSQYKEFAKTFVLVEHSIEAVNSGVLINKLLQLCNGSVYNEEKEPIEIHDYKVDHLEELIESARGDPVLVGYDFQFDLKKILKRFPKAIVLKEESDVVRKWNDGSIKILLTHPASASYGLNMQHGGHIAIWYGLVWNLAWYLQFNKRLHRRGQKNDVDIWHILCKGTEEMYQYERLNTKNATQESVLNRFRVTYDDIRLTRK